MRLPPATNSGYAGPKSVPGVEQAQKVIDFGLNSLTYVNLTYILRKEGKDMTPESTVNTPVSTPAPAANTKRVNVVFSADQFSKLQNLATSQNISLSDALRQAISLSKLIVDANADKNTQILFKQGDNIQEMKLVI
jgi:hypothetical protein